MAIFDFIFFGYIASLVFLKFPERTVFASPPAPAPKCSVAGLIENVRFEKAYEEPCVKTKSCPTDMQLSYPDTYYLSVKIQSVSLKEGDTRFRSCENLYQIGSTQEIFIIKDKVRSGDSFNRGQQIEGGVSSFWGNSFDSYQITSVTPIDISLPETPPIGQKPPSVFEKMKSFISAILSLISNFLNGVKTAETKTK